MLKAVKASAGFPGLVAGLLPFVKDFAAASGMAQVSLPVARGRVSPDVRSTRSTAMNDDPPRSTDDLRDDALIGNSATLATLLPIKSPSRGCFQEPSISPAYNAKSHSPRCFCAILGPTSAKLHKAKGLKWTPLSRRKIAIS